MKPYKKQSGFTLIEILIVVFIMGVVLGLTRLNFNRNLDTVAHSEAKRFARVLAYTKEYSAYTGRILSLRLDKRKNTYFFLYVDPIARSWNKLDDKSGSKLLSAHKINERVKVTAKKRNAETQASQTDSLKEDEDAKKSSHSEIALITPFSEFEPANLILNGESRQYIVTTDEFDDVEIQIQ